MAAAMYEPETECWYTPERVVRILRDLPNLPFPSYALDGRIGSSQASGSDSWLIEQLARRADVESALHRLPQPIYRMVYLYYVGGRSLREVAAITGYSHTTVRENRDEGVRRIAWELGWRDASIGWGEPAMLRRS